MKNLKLEVQTKLEVQINERSYQMMLPQNANLGELHDVLFQMRSYVIEKIIEAQKADAPKTAEEMPIQETNEQ